MIKRMMDFFARKKPRLLAVIQFYAIHFYYYTKPTSVVIVVGSHITI